MDKGADMEMGREEWIGDGYRMDREKVWGKDSGMDIERDGPVLFWLHLLDYTVLILLFWPTWSPYPGCPLHICCPFLVVLF